MTREKKYNISIITPSYNSGEYLERAIKSVLIQDYKNWEHLIMDGGSTDNTLNILKKYPHLRWISENDYGQADAMNKGFNKCTGDIIVYLNADDYFFPNAFTSVIKEFQKGAKFVVGDVLVKSPRQKKTYINKPATTLVKMLHHWEPNAFPQNSTGYFYLREVQKKFPFKFNNIYSMDLEFLLNAVSEYKFCKINKILGCYHDDINTQTGISQGRLDYWQSKNFPFIQKHLDNFSDEEKWKFYREQHDGYCMIQAHMNRLHKFNFINSNIAPFISVIIPTYNDVLHIQKAINSVLNQKTKNIEIIIVDDASTDDTYRILKKNYKNNKKIRIYRNKKNLRLGATRNIGLSKAKGKYVFFLDSDDWIDEDTLLHLVSISEQYNCEIVSCGIKKVYKNNIKEHYHSYAFSCSGGIEALSYFSEYKIASTAWNKLYLRSFLSNHKLKFIDKYWHEDVMFTAQAIYACKKYMSISNEYYNYYQSPSSIINSEPTTLHLLSYIKLFTNLSEFIHKKKLNKNFFENQLSRELIQSHAINNVIPNLLRYNLTHSNWNEDYLEVLSKVFKRNSVALAGLISALLCTINPEPSQSNIGNYRLSNNTKKHVFAKLKKLLVEKLIYAYEKNK